VDLNDVNVFLAVVRARSFSSAASELDLPASAVSRRVARLEKALGQKLLHRTTRRVGLTEPGRVLYERMAGLPRLVADAKRAIAATTETASGSLRVTAPPDDTGVIWALFEGFLRDHPHVDLQILHGLKNVDLAAEDIDVALRGGSPPDSPDFVAHLLWDSRMVLVASPEYLELHGTPRTVEDLSDHVGVCMDPWAPNAIRRLDGDHSFVRVNMRNRLRANSLDTARRAVVAGLGIAPLVAFNCQEELDAGSLVEVLRGALPQSATFYVVSRLPSVRSPAATALVEHVRRVAPLIG
jgi:DNA-binding transcriptional LysR family regulator